MIRLRSFGTKLLLLLALVVAVAQFATYFVVSRANRATARQLIAEDLASAAAVFQRVVSERNDLLATGASSAAGDYAFKPLFADTETDAATLISALESIRLRNSADVATLLDLDGTTLACTARAPRGSHGFRRLAQQADADPAPNPRATGYGYIEHELYSLVVVPVRIPDIVRWLVVGFRIDDAFARRLKDQTRVDVTFADHENAILATTLPPSTAAALSESIPSLQSQTDIVTALLAGESSLLSTSTLPAGEGQHATLALQYSLAEKLKPALATERLLLFVACGSLLAAALLGLGFARRLSRPVEALAEHTRRIAQGDYATRIKLNRSDELGRLADSFNAMSAGLAERDRVRDLLDKNVSPEVAAQLLRDGAALGGEEREVTILFADLRGFTTLSEKLPPQELLHLLNRYLDRMSREIERHGGVIDKFIGDAIMALFGAPLSQPDAARRAVAAALAMERALADLNAELAAEPTAPLSPPGCQLTALGSQLSFGIGLNTARVVAGNIGSQRRLNYSVIGDGVNVAARLQSLTRTPEYRTNILASAATVSAARPSALAPDLAAAPSASGFTARPLGPILLKGRAEPVEIFAVSASL
ncbi:MAG TPA: adenylate/guanylate cyclase domain-containing protein [Opitutus sp.]|nr:adenylate/guanylate cyclase domain-containing protein [Opitutus sp.]